MVNFRLDRTMDLRCQPKSPLGDNINTEDFFIDIDDKLGREESSECFFSLLLKC